MNRPTSPGEYIREHILSPNGWTQLQLADKLGVAPSAISMAINGDRHLAPGLILKLSGLTGKDPQFWLDLQAKYSNWASTDQGKSNLRQTAQNKLIENWEQGGFRLLVDSEIVSGRELGLLDIQDFSPESLQSASYDLRVGTIVLGTDGSMEIPNGDDIEIPPGQIATIQSIERLRLSDRICARVGPPTKMTMQFLFYSAAAQVDPGYEGEIFVSVKNEGKHPVHLRKKETEFLTIEFYFLPNRPDRTFGSLRTSSSLPPATG